MRLMRHTTSFALIVSSLLLSTAAWAEDPLPPLPSTATPPPAPAAETRESPAQTPAASPTPPPPYSPPPFVARHYTYRPMPVEAPAPPEDDGALGSRQRFVRFGIGVRTGNVSDAAFAPFSKDSALTQLSLDASLTLLTRGSFSFAAGLSFDTGGADAVTRDQKFRLFAHRVAIPLEGRLHFFPWLFAFGKVAPGAVILKATAEEPSVTLKTTAATFSADLSAGASFLIGAQKRPHEHPFRAWITPEFGYGFTGKVPMKLEADDARLGTMELASLSTGGLFFRIGVGFGF